MIANYVFKKGLLKNGSYVGLVAQQSFKYTIKRGCDIVKYASIQ